MEQEFTISTGMKIFYGILAVVMFVFSIVILKIYNPAVTPFVLIMPLLILAGAVCIIVNLVRKKLIIYTDSILYINLFSTREIAIADVISCRIGQKVILLELTTGKSKLTISNYGDLESSDELVKYFKENFKDLDEIDLQNERQIALQSNELGITEQDREAALKKAKVTAIIYNGVGTLLTFLSIFFRGDIGTILLLIYPLLAIPVLVLSKGLIKFLSNRKRSVYAFITFGTSFPGFLLLVKSLDEYNLFSLNHLWLPGLFFTAMLFLPLYFLGVNRAVASVIGQSIFMLMISLTYGFGATRQINCLFDHSKPDVYKAVILDRRVQHGKSSSYFLMLSRWGPRQNYKEVEIHRHLYESINLGDTVKVNYKKGLLNIPWFMVAKN